ncbi:hypothetical protein [Nocardia sp. SYP-A9097]|uniref:hypothetical protein n=1 Tax=Nocardia sp. SYP-A9097 TaxID=2663237 RepID=UPI001E5FDF57|nr:hypothetical protein [Nocardia sp. SYP-A9097]
MQQLGIEYLVGVEENRFWSGLAAEMPEFLSPDHDDEQLWQSSRQDDVVLLHDVRTGGRIVFTGNGISIEIFVELPSGAAGKSRLMAMIGSELSGRTWNTGRRQARISTIDNKFGIDGGGGAQPYFEPARNLYAKYGFTPCEPFPPYRPDPHSVFMTRELSP